MANQESKSEKGKLASAKGFANESRVLAALLARGYNASRVDLPHSTYDVVLESKLSEIIRIQVKTVSPSGTISFTGGTRGGIDREYKSSVKEYQQSTETSDIVVGVKAERANGDKNIDFYFIPTILVENLKQKSLSVNKVPETKNNWTLLGKCKAKEFVEKEISLYDIS